jgi:hypothetical protein
MLLRAHLQTPRCLLTFAVVGAGPKPTAAFLTFFACHLGRLTDVPARWRARLPASTVLFSAQNEADQAARLPTSLPS